VKRRSFDPKEWYDRYGDVSWEEPFFEHSAMDWKMASIRAEVQDFISCIVNNRQPLVTGRDGLRAIQIVSKAYESSRLGREVEV
jgi:predicted dehydrogenase